MAGSSSSLSSSAILRRVIMDEQLPISPASHPRGTTVRTVRYPAAYTWIVLLASLDLMLTWVILHQGGQELNRLADSVIDRYGLWGLSAFKFGMISFVICLCEFIGRQRPGSGRFLAVVAILLNCVPVTMASYLLLTRLG
jgi:hypothetical protein